jgi:hypothetical protein
MAMYLEIPSANQIVAKSKWLRSFAQARAAAAVTMVVQIAVTFLDVRLHRPGYLIGLRIGHAIFAAGILVFLQVRGRKLSLGAVIGSTLLLLLPLVPIFWFTENAAVSSSPGWGPFVGHRLILVAAAILVPGPLWVPAAVIAVFASSALLHYFMLADKLVGLEEPWITGIHGAVAVAILSLRAQLEALKEKLARASSAVNSLDELARTARFVKDGTASPLQTIVAATLLLRGDTAERRELLDRIDRAAERIELLVATLDRYEESDGLQMQSFDARSELERQRVELLRRARSLSTNGSQSAPLEETGGQGGP